MVEKTKKQLDVEEKKAAKQKKEREEREKKTVMTDYEKHLQEVTDLQTMTDTKCWRDFYRHVQKSITEHAKAVLDAEKTRDVVCHQEGVKILRKIKKKIAEPVEGLKNFINNMPLFAPEMKTRAEWNEGLGIVEIKEL